MIQDRRANPIDKEDLLNIMLNGVDKKTGKKLSDENIRHNVSNIRGRALVRLMCAGASAY